MTLFAPDLFRNFMFGFAAGALMVGAATIGQWGPHIESPASAAQPLDAPYSSGDLAADFAIEPIRAAE